MDWINIELVNFGCRVSRLSSGCSRLKVLGLSCCGVTKLRLDYFRIDRHGLLELADLVWIIVDLEYWSWVALELQNLDWVLVELADLSFRLNKFDLDCCRLIFGLYCCTVKKLSYFKVFKFELLYT